MDAKYGPTFFGVADGRLGQSMSQEKFETLLLQAVLFDDEIIFTDVFVFDPRVEKHIFSKERGESLIETGIRAGIIRPGVRREIGGYAQIFDYLTEADRAAVRITESMEREYADRLAPYAGSDWRPALWPTRMGDTYRQTLIDCLTEGQPLANDVDGVWDATIALRSDVIRQAAEAELKSGGYGVRRAQIVARAGRHLNVLADGEFTSNADVVLERMPTSPERRAAAHFFDWIDEIYRINQAIRFDCRPVSFAHRAIDLQVVGRALASVREQDDLPRPMTSWTHPLSMTVDIPSLSNVARLPATRILELRDFGLSWRNACAEFLSEPTDVMRRRAEAALEMYARRLRKEVKGGSLEQAAVTVIGLEMGRSVIESVAEFLQWDFQAPPLHTSIAVFLSGYVAVKYLRRGRTTRWEISRGGALDRITTLPRA